MLQSQSGKARTQFNYSNASALERPALWNLSKLMSSTNRNVIANQHAKLFILKELTQTTFRLPLQIVRVYFACLPAFDHKM